MADELIRCPSCDHELRVPPELLGRAVECPQCSSRFTAPTVSMTPNVRAAVLPPGNEPPPGDPDMLAARAGMALRPPAILLLITCGIGLLWNGFGLLSAASVRSDPVAFANEVKRQLDQNPDLTPQERDQLQAWLEPKAFASNMTLFCGGHFVANLLILVGAIQMLRLGGYGFAVLGSIIALNPINLPCCLVQAPFGLWALIVLLNSEVRSAFR